MTTAIVLGNGQSRKSISPESLKTHGTVYACNAIYREFTPDVLIATDLPISMAIQESGYALRNRFYTRKPMEGLGAQRLSKEYYGFSSGPNAVGRACLDGYTRIYMLGFDLGTSNGQFNNIYADTEFYKNSTAPPTFAGNWIRQITQICKDYSTREFVRVVGPESATIPALNEIPNMQTMTILDLKDRINTNRGLL
jgi:hypothetical protein